MDDIAMNLDVLTAPNDAGFSRINMKDAIALLRECEEFVKGNEQADVSPLDAVMEFLNS